MTIRTLSGLLSTIFILLSYPVLYGQFTDANIFGDVQSEGEHIPFATIYVEGTITGTATDVTGNYVLINLPAPISLLLLPWDTVL